VPEPAGLAQVRDAVATARDGGLAGFDVVVELPVGEQAQPWAAAGATWVPTRSGPYDLGLDQVRGVVRAAPG
jgi:hypothetical protein